jgi:hypothetical protein
VHDLILHALIDAVAPKWLRLQARYARRRAVQRGPDAFLLRTTQAPVPRVVVFMLNGLNSPTWEREQGVLTCLRNRFEPPVRVYGASLHTTSGSQPRVCLSGWLRNADLP